jgi:hypothetical protein
MLANRRHPDIFLSGIARAVSKRKRKGTHVAKKNNTYPKESTMLYCISYDLNSPGQDYSGLFKAIESCGAWWHYLDSTWLVDTDYSAESIYARLKPHLDDNDRVLVVRVGSESQGWLPQKAWDWIRQHRVAA